MTIKSLNVTLGQPWYEDGKSFFHIIITATPTRPLTEEEAKENPLQKHLLFLKDRKTGLGLPEFTEEYLFDLWNTHKSCDICPTKTRKTYSSVVLGLNSDKVTS